MTLKDGYRPSFRFSANRTDGSRRVRYSEGNHINTEECLLCIPTKDVEACGASERHTLLAIMPDDQSSALEASSLTGTDHELPTI